MGGTSSGAGASLPNLRPKYRTIIISYLLLETQFTVFIAPVQASGYCMQN